MTSFLLAVLALWVLQHTVTTQIAAKWPKPWSCTLCFTGWICITASGYMVLGHGWDFGLAYMIGGALWAAVVLLEALYWRLSTIAF